MTRLTAGRFDDEGDIAERRAGVRGTARCRSCPPRAPRAGPRLDPQPSSESLACTRPTRPGPGRRDQLVEHRGDPARRRSGRGRRRTCGRCRGRSRPSGAARRRPGTAPGRPPARRASGPAPPSARTAGRDRRRRACRAAGAAISPSCRSACSRSGPAHRRPGVHHHAPGADLAAPLQRVRDRGGRLRRHRRVARPQVDQVRRVDEDGETAVAQQPVLAGVARPGRPAARIGHEHLDDLGPDLGRIRQPAGREPAGHGRVRPDQSHRGVRRTRRIRRRSR